jgi:hypothetical protein
VSLAEAESPERPRPERRRRTSIRQATRFCGIASTTSRSHATAHAHAADAMFEASARPTAAVCDDGTYFALITLPEGARTYHRPPLRLSAWPVAIPGLVSPT